MLMLLLLLVLIVGLPYKQLQKWGMKLLAAGADVNAPPSPGYYGWTALQAAAKMGHEAIVEKLMAAGANANGYGRTA
jgi:surface antigen